MKTLEQSFAAQIYDQVSAYGGQHPLDSDERKQYGSMAHKLPVLLHTAGLVQALAFVHSRGKDPHQELLGHLAQVVMEGDVEAFLQQSREVDLQNYIYLTNRTMLALKWYKRFAQSVLKVEPAEEGD
jgi:CRISPR-associated protein Cmr5